MNVLHVHTEEERCSGFSFTYKKNSRIFQTPEHFSRTLSQHSNI